MAIADETVTATEGDVKELEKGLAGAKQDAVKDDDVDAESDSANADATATAQETDEDEHPGESNDDELSSDEKRERNRRWREERKRRQKEREEEYQRQITAQRAQLDELQGRLAVIERRSTGSELAAIDAHIKDTAEVYKHFKSQIAAQSQAGNHEGVAEAVEKMNLAQRRFEQLNAVKQGFVKNQQQPPALDPRLVNHAQAWMGNNKWYNPAGTDPDSMRAMTEDRILASEGWDPTTAEFWTELSHRVAKVLPHRAKSGYNDPVQSTKSSRPGASVAGSSGFSNAGQAPKGSFKLSEERVRAIKEAGHWDDPDKRAKMIENFKRYDRDQQRT